MRDELINELPDELKALIMRHWAENVHAFFVRSTKILNRKMRLILRDYKDGFYTT